MYPADTTKKILTNRKPTKIFENLTARILQTAMKRYRPTQCPKNIDSKCFIII